MEKNAFHEPENQLSTCRNNPPPAGIFLNNWIPPNFNNAFHKQKESSGIHAQSKWCYFLKIGFPQISTGRKKIIF